MEPCTEYQSLLMEHDTLMREYETRVEVIATLSMHERRLALDSCHELLQAAESALQISKIHKVAHGC